MSWKRAFAEGAVIVGSILLAFGIDAWWNGREEARQALESERIGLTLLLADLVADTAEIRSVLYFAGLHDRAAAEVLHAVDSSTAPDTIGFVLRDFIEGDAHSLQRSAFLSLRGADRLSLIRSDSLRAAVLQYFDEGQPELDSGQALELARRERLLASLSKHARWPKPETRVTSWPFESGPVVLDDWDRFRLDNETVWTIQDLGGLSHDVRRNAEELLLGNFALRAMIEVELQSRWP